jgi:hypothetical protein
MSSPLYVEKLLVALREKRRRGFSSNGFVFHVIGAPASGKRDALVRKGLEDFRKGRVVSHAEVVNRLKRVGRARR